MEAPFPAPAAGLRSRPDLRHIPGSDGLPLVGDTFAMLADSFGYPFKMHKRYGPIFRNYIFFEPGVTVSNPAFTERFFLDKEQIFSSEYGWQNLLGDFFRNGLMLRDFAVHRLHRRIMQTAFTREALLAYLEILTPLITRSVAALAGRRELLVFPWLKQLTLDAAATVFLGLALGAETSRLKRLFIDIMAASVSPLRWNLPLSAYRRGKQARDELRRFFLELIPGRRSGSGRDMLSLLCTKQSEEGERFSDDEIADHMLFLLMAAHDTTTSALSNLILELGRSSAWQSRLREQSRTIESERLDEGSLAKLELLYDSFREVLRLYPPVCAIPRRTLRDCEILGYRVPANTQVWVIPDVAHRDAAVWSNPDAFDPERFAEPRAEHKKHRFAWIPFGSGAHICLGLQFGELFVKSLMHTLLRSYEWRIRDGGAQVMQRLPFPKAKDDLPIVLLPCR